MSYIFLIGFIYCIIVKSSQTKISGRRTGGARRLRTMISPASIDTIHRNITDTEELYLKSITVPARNQRSYSQWTKDTRTRERLDNLCQSISAWKDIEVI